MDSCHSGLDGTANFYQTEREKSGQLPVTVWGSRVVLFPVAARNASLGGEWSPTTFQAGPNFYIGNNLQSNGLYKPLVPGHETPKYERADAQRLAERDYRPHIDFPGGFKFLVRKII